MMDSCIILHNTIVEDERSMYGGQYCRMNDSNVDFQELLHRRSFDDRDKQIYRCLQQNLIEHI